MLSQGAALTWLIRRYEEFFWLMNLYSAITKHSANVRTMLAYCLRRWPNIVPILAERPVLPTGPPLASVLVVRKTIFSLGLNDNV